MRSRSTWQSHQKLVFGSRDPSSVHLNSCNATMKQLQTLALELQCVSYRIILYILDVSMEGSEQPSILLVYCLPLIYIAGQIRAILNALCHDDYVASLDNLGYGSVLDLHLFYIFTTSFIECYSSLM
jgi:hypothetical protein